MSFDTHSEPRNRAERRAAAKATGKGKRTSAAVLLASGSALASTAMVLGGGSVVGAATTITVDSTGDATPVAAHCTNVTTGDCTLRDAVAAAVDGDMIQFNLPAASTITLTQGEIVIKDLNLTISGPGATNLTIDGNNNDRIFDIYSSGGPLETVTISGLTFTKGSAGSDGGAIDANHMNLAVTDSVFTANYAEDDGGAIGFENSTGTLTISGSHFTANSAADDGGAIQLNGAYGAVLIESSVLSGNSAANGGGGIYGEQGSASKGSAKTITISGSEITGNTAGDGGGGMKLDDWYGLITVTSSTISSNSASDWGGGIYLEDAWGGVSISGSTISDNQADHGGGIATWEGYGPVSITGTTISGNTASSDGGGVAVAYLIDRTGQNDATVSVSTSTISGNVAGGNGGGLWFGTWRGEETRSNYADITVLDSTVSGNTAQSGGGGVWVAYNYGTTSIIQSTLTGNVAHGGEGSSYDGGAVAFRQSQITTDSLSIVQATISGNTGRNVGGVYLPAQTIIATKGTAHTRAKPAASAHEDDPSKGTERARGNGVHTKGKSLNPAHASVVGTILAANAGDDVGSGGSLTASSSIFTKIASGTTFTNGGGNQLNVATLFLGPLQNNGGPTDTMALLPGSPAIDAGAVPPPDYPTNDFDQRGDGFTRVVAGVIDVGAFEVQPPPVIQPTFTG